MNIQKTFSRVAVIATMLGTAGCGRPLTQAELQASAPAAISDSKECSNRAGFY